MLAWLALTDPILRFAVWVGLAAFGLTFLLILQIIFMRLRLKARERSAAATIALWRPILAATLTGNRPETLPELTNEQVVEYFRLWLHFQISLRGDTRDALNRLGYRLGCHTIAMRLHDKGNRGEMLLAVLVLGHLKHEDAYDALLRRVGMEDRLLSMHASWALMQIDPARAVESMVPPLIMESNWPVREVVTVLSQAQLYCQPVLLSMLPRLDVRRLPRLLQVMEGLRLPLPAGELSALLDHENVEILITALRITADPLLRSWVINLCRHANWRVRMQAARTLGRIGQPNDIVVLIDLMSDREWWVRYRSAEALASLPFLDKSQLNALADAAADRYAGDMLRQVLAEKGNA